MPPGHVAVPGCAPSSQPMRAPGVQRSKKPLFTLTGFFFASNEMFSGTPLLKPFAARYATKPSLKREQMYAGHSPEWKLKSNLKPLAFIGAFISRCRFTTSFTSVAIGQLAAAFG